MFEKLAGKTGIVLGVAVLMLCTASLLYLSVRQFAAMLDDARAQGRAERDHYWRAEIEKSNAATQAQITENLKLTMAAQERARDDVEAAERRADELEKMNAELPENPCGGIGRDRIRLLNQR